jgi:hypothetical protein
MGTLGPRSGSGALFVEPAPAKRSRTLARRGCGAPGGAAGHFFLALVLLAAFGLAAGFARLPDRHPHRLHAISVPLQKDVPGAGTVRCSFYRCPAPGHFSPKRTGRGARRDGGGTGAQGREDGRDLKDRRDQRDAEGASRVVGTLRLAMRVSAHTNSSLRRGNTRLLPGDAAPQVFQQKDSSGGARPAPSCSACLTRGPI